MISLGCFALASLLILALCLAYVADGKAGEARLLTATRHLPNVLDGEL